MRWLVTHPGPNFSVSDLHAGYVEALRAAGEHVIDFPLGELLSFYDNVFLRAGVEQFKKALDGVQATQLAVDRLAGALYKVRPDVLFVVSGFFLDQQIFDVARRDGVKVVTLHTEEPYEHSRELELARHSDLCLLTEPVHIDDFRQITRAEHFGHAYRPAVHHPGPPDPDLACDLAFVGTGYPSRIAFLEAMDLQDLDVVLAGNWQLLNEESPLRPDVAHDTADCLDNADTARLYRSARVGLNLYRREAEAAGTAEGWAVGPREIEMAACSLPFVRDPRGEGNELFGHLPTFTSPAEAADQIAWLLTHDTERAALADKSRAAVADRTFDAHAARLLRLLDKE